MRVGFLVRGTRGDAQPYVALARELQARGHIACVFTNVDLVPFVEAYGIQAVPVYPPDQESIQAYGGWPAPADINDFVSFRWEWAEEWMSENTHVLGPLEALRQYRPQLLLHSTGMGDALDAKEILGIPTVCACLCEDALGQCGSQDVLVGMSPLLVPQLCTVMNMHVTGFWHIKHDTELASHHDCDELLAFLDTEAEKPVYIGWGSMRPKSMNSYQMLGLALRILRLLGKRGIIGNGLSGMHAALADLHCAPEHCSHIQDFIGQGHHDATAAFDDLRSLQLYAKERVYLAPEAPHELLFPRCACIVHHGGAGTTGTALRSGRPQVITPVYVDQFTTAKKMQKLGLGRGLKSLHLLSAEDVANAIDCVLGSEQMLQAALDFSDKLRDENGVNGAVDWLESFHAQNCAKDVAIS